MGSKWFTGGVVAATHGRIQFDFMFEGVRYRPSIRRPPSEANLRRARERLDEIKRQIRAGTFSSEEIALVLSDLDLVNGIVSVNKARVAGVDRCQTKTGEDRRITLCPRALAVLKRQLGLRARLQDAGVVQHDHVFFRESGEPFWNLLIQGKRWRATLSSLKLRYRRG